MKKKEEILKIKYIPITGNKRQNILFVRIKIEIKCFFLYEVYFPW